MNHKSILSDPVELLTLTFRLFFALLWWNSRPLLTTDFLPPKSKNTFANDFLEVSQMPPFGIIWQLVLVVPHYFLLPSRSERVALRIECKSLLSVVPS
ncbi:hypothetical protein AVEN_242465-1 [Araneus ventricosus]|uniref:Uncharacterized protein n=1 Tax=Araneus ventricosus TaxID=182803 RepID=A0A4Y2S894_ARAVE|nr:hypothetical protein AVEN_242465-1 [Araneus ventricosus]